MKKRILHVPLREAGAPTAIDVGEKPLKAWIDALPLMDFSRSCDEVAAALYDLNRHHIDIAARIKAISLLSDRVDKLHKIIPRSFESDSLPLTEKRLRSKIGPIKLLSECAIGHKIIVNDLATDKSLLGRHKKALFFSIVKAMHYMSLELIERFLVYRTPADGAWQDIHKLYTISEQTGVLDVAISGNAATGESATSIDELYKKILLLSLADLSRLMIGEAETLYKQLGEWAKLTSLAKPDKSFREGVVVDLGIDAPANHVYSEKPLKFLNGRVFEISRLLQHMDEQIEMLAEQGKKASNMLSARSRQAMYIRLRYTWGTRGERGDVREPINNPVKLISGLHDCHRGLSGDAPFNPEYDELRYDPEWNEAKEATQDGLSLVPEEDAPWEREEIEARAASNFNSNRVSQFDENSKSDTWEKIYSHKLAEIGRQERESTPLVITDCIQVDTSPGGMAIVCDSQRVDASLAVGKVIAVAETEKGDCWQVGLVRWLVMLPNNDIRCGVQLLSEHAQTIATKAIKGVGEDGEYFRGVMIPADGDLPASIIVPAAIYSTNTILSVVVGEELKYVEIKALLNNSSSYNQFSFQEIERPKLSKGLKAKIERNRRAL